MPRVPYVSADDSSDVAERIRARRGGKLLALDRMLLHSPPVADGWNVLLGAVRGATSLNALVRELIILRVAVLNGAEYEREAHTSPARSAGATDAWLDGIAEWRRSGEFSPVERAVLGFVDSSTSSVSVPDEVFAELRPHFSERELVEIAAVTAVYNCVSRFLVATGITSAGDG